MSGEGEVGVMMGWEKPISCVFAFLLLPLGPTSDEQHHSLVEETVKLLRGNSFSADFRVLNCGFGLGIVSESSIVSPMPPGLIHLECTDRRSLSSS